MMAFWLELAGTGCMLLWLVFGGGLVMFGLLCWATWATGCDLLEV